MLRVGRLRTLALSLRGMALEISDAVEAMPKDVEVREDGTVAIKESSAGLSVVRKVTTAAAVKLPKLCVAASSRPTSHTHRTLSN